MSYPEKGFNFIGDLQSLDPSKVSRTLDRRALMVLVNKVVGIFGEG